MKNDLFNNIKLTEMIEEDEIVIPSNFDYKEFSQEEKEELLDLEHQATYFANQINNSIRELGEIFYKAQEKFANRKTGNFVFWFENLGFKRTFVYLCLGRKSLSEKYGSELPYQLPEREVQLLSKLDKKDEESKIFKVLESENPREELKVIIQEEKENKKYKETIDPLQKSFDDFEEAEYVDEFETEIKREKHSEEVIDNHKEKQKKKYLKRMNEIEFKLIGKVTFSKDEEKTIDDLLDKIEKICDSKNTIK